MRLVELRGVSDTTAFYMTPLVAYKGMIQGRQKYKKRNISVLAHKMSCLKKGVYLRLYFGDTDNDTAE